MTFDIVDIEEFSGRMAKIYSIILEGDEDTLLDQFFEENSQYEEELSEIARKLMVMGENTGCRIQFSRRMRAHPETASWRYGTKECGYIV